MPDYLIDRVALALSYLWHALALPFHSGRLASIRLSRHSASFELAQAARRERDALVEVIRTAQKMEQDLAGADLALEPSRRLAVLALRRALARLRQLVADGFSEDRPTPGPPRDWNGAVPASAAHGP
jgi:hypothetical protein